MSRVRWMLPAVLLLAAALPAWAAHDLTDAMTSPDPRIKLESGTGRVYDNRYGDDQALPPASESELDVPGFEYQRSRLFDRSPLDEAPGENSRDKDALGGDENPDAPSDDLPALGKAEARPGVYYPDDLQHH